MCIDPSAWPLRGRVDSWVIEVTLEVSGVSSITHVMTARPAVGSGTLTCTARPWNLPPIAQGQAIYSADPSCIPTAFVYTKRCDNARRRGRRTKKSPCQQHGTGIRDLVTFALPARARDRLCLQLLQLLLAELAENTRASAQGGVDQVGPT